MIAAGGAVLTILVVPFLGMQMTTGWDWLKLNWEPRTYYLIVAVLGAVTGLFGDPCRVPGLLAGVLATTGSLYLTSSYLDAVDKTIAIVAALVSFVGYLPGLILFFAWAWVFEAVTGLNWYPRGGPALPQSEDPENGI